MAIGVHPVSGSLGAVVTGFDLTRPLGEQELATLRHAVLDHLVIFLPDQTMGPEDLVRLTGQLGGHGDTPFLRSIDGFPGVVRVVKEVSEAGTFNFGGAWHSDYSFQPKPPSFTLLYAVDVPPYGGDTLWSNQYLAYETLSDGLRATLDGLTAVHSAGGAYAPDGFFARTAKSRTMTIDPSEEARAEQSHPVAILHPETGRRALFVNPTYTLRFTGWTTEESRWLLGELYRHSVREAFCCRFRWSNRTLAIWDNRCTQHNALNDYDGFRRELLRTTVAGNAPRG